MAELLTLLALVVMSSDVESGAAVVSRLAAFRAEVQPSTCQLANRS